MGKAIRLGIEQFFHHVGGERLLDGVEAIRLGQRIIHCDEHRQLELAADHRGVGEHLIAGCRQPVQPRADDFPHARGQRRVLAAARRREQPAHLGEEERIALGAFEQLRQAGLGRSVRADELARLVQAQSAQRHTRVVRSARQIAQRAEQRMTPVDLGVAVRAEQEQARIGRVGGEELQQPQRSGVGPVQIVDDEHDPARRRRALPEGGQRVEQPEARLCRVGRGRLANRGARLGRLGHDIDDPACPASQRARDFGRLMPIDVGAQQLHPGPIGRCTGFFRATSPQHFHSRRCGVRGQLLRRTRFADAGLAREHDDLRLPVARAQQSLIQCQEFLASPDEVRARSGCRRRREWWAVGR